MKNVKLNNKETINTFTTALIAGGLLAFTATSQAAVTTLITETSTAGGANSVNITHGFSEVTTTLTTGFSPRSTLFPYTTLFRSLG